MRWPFQTYIYILHGVHDFFSGLWDDFYDPELLDVYDDKRSAIHGEVDIELFNTPTRAALDDFIIKMEDFLEWSEDLRLSDEEFGNSARWKLVQESSKFVYAALDEYMRGMGIIPGAIYVNQRKYSELRLKK